LAIINRLSETNLLADKARAEPPSDGDFELDQHLIASAAKQPGPESPPVVPDRLSPSQGAQLAELLEYIHAGIGEVVDGIQSSESRGSVTISQSNWQSLLLVYSNLSELIRSIADPEFKLPG
jgi:hypothetical protein